MTICAALFLLPGITTAQTPSTELEITAGYATEGIAAFATQLRTFGELKSGLRYYGEAAGAGRSAERSDAFSGAYYYGDSLKPTEAYLEQQFRGRRLLSGVRAGRYRTPFGISGRGDHAYNGFMRPPLVRYGYYHALSNYWLEGGVNGFVGTPQLQLEVSLGIPQEGLDARRAGLGSVARLQAYQGSLILGASYMTTRPKPTERYISGNGRYTGLDARWQRNGIQLRGEWIDGRPFQDAHFRGWYIDTQAHRPALGPFTPVARYEHYVYSHPGYRSNRSRWTVGTRVRVTPSLNATVNLLSTNVFSTWASLNTGTRRSLDVGVTQSWRF